MSTDKSKMEKTEKKRLRVSTSASEDIEEQVAMAELLERISLVEHQTVEREARITSLETQLANANLMIQKLKKTTNDLQNSIDQFRYIKIQPKTIDLSTRLLGINTEFVWFIPKSLVLRSIVLG